MLHAPRGPFYSPRQLGVVGSPFGRQFLSSVGWRTGQSGAPPDMNSARFLSFSGEADRWALGPLGTLDIVRCSLVTVGSGHASPANRAADRWRERCWLTGQSGAHRTVWWILATMSSTIPESGGFVAEPNKAPDTVRCTPDSPVQRRLVLVWLNLAKLLQSNLIWFDTAHST
jgi:hypothetical protein